MSEVVFSVVIPAYNRAGVISTAIQSVLSQTYDKFEVVVVDDGSSDNTEEVVRSFQDPRVRYVYQKNSGAPRARNHGVQCANGDFIAFLDSDDQFFPHHLEQALPILRSGKNVCTYTQVQVERGGDVRFLKPPRAIRHGEAMSDYLLRDRGFVQTSVLIVSRVLALKVPYDEGLKGGQDTDLAIRLWAEGADIRMLDRPGAIWYDEENPNRISNKGYPLLREEWLVRIRDKLTRKAYWADLGWHVAKGHFRHGNFLKASFYYLRALITGCYRPKMALVVFMQVFVSPRSYRRISDVLAGLGVKP